MAPKLPGKFDDISKTASSVLGDDFQCKGFQLKSKQTTKAVDSWHTGAHVELTTDLFGAGDCKTPTKLGFKFPKPFTFVQGIAVEKLEIDKEGKGNLEVLVGDALHGVNGLKLEVKSAFPCQELTNHSLSFCSTYTAIKDTSIKIETKQADPTNVGVEILHGIGSSVIGAKLNGLNNGLCPSMGVNFASGDFFGSVIAKQQFTEFTAHGFYKVSNDIKVAATYQQGGKTSGNWAAAGAYTFSPDLTAKAKFDQSQTVSLGFKRAVAKGTSLVGGMSYAVSNGAITYGAKLSIE